MAYATSTENMPLKEEFYANFWNRHRVRFPKKIHSTETNKNWSDVLDFSGDGPAFRIFFGIHGLGLSFSEKSGLRKMYSWKYYLELLRILSK